MSIDWSRFGSVSPQCFKTCFSDGPQLWDRRDSREATEKTMTGLRRSTKKLTNFVKSGMEKLQSTGDKNSFFESAVMKEKDVLDIFTMS